MSGHNKWSKIKHTKGKIDAARSATWTKIIRELTVAVRSGGGPDIGSNPRLRKAVDDAKASGMPKDTMNRAIQRGAGGDDSAVLEELIYEGYGPGGVAALVEVTTDNRNRSASEIRAIFTKTGGNMATSGAVAWQFTRKAVFSFDKAAGATEDRVMEVALDAGAEDVADAGDSIDVKAEPNAYHALLEAFDKASLAPAHKDIVYVPQTTIRLTGQDASTMLKLVERLEECDDVQKVHANFDLDPAELEALTKE